MTVESHNFSITLPTGLIEGTIRAEVHDYDGDDEKEVLDWVEVKASWMPNDEWNEVYDITNLEIFEDILDYDGITELNTIILGF